MDLELTLSRPDTRQAQVAVACNDQPSHTFDLRTILPNKTNGLPHPIDDPIEYGTALYAALFPPDSPAQQALDRRPERILLVVVDPDLDTIPWEYTYGPDGFLVCDYPFVRGLPAGQRVTPPAFSSSLHIIAVPSNPLSADLAPLNIEGEWTRLVESIEVLENAVTLERAWPPIIDRLRALVANQPQRVVHFMGHGGQDEHIGAVLCFEQENGALEIITAREFVKRMRGVFLVTLNACESATPGESHFSNLAAALVRERVPYALGMRFSIYDDDARAFSAAFYNDLACGTPAEEALLQARLTLAKSAHPWAIGIPVLYTSLALTSERPAPGFIAASGTPDVIDPRDRRRDRIDVLPRVEGIFQGRIEEQLRLGAWLTGDERPRIITIHGGGGQGKTALARVAAERFAHAWPGGVYALILENLHTRAVLVADLARFLNIDVQAFPDAADLEGEVARRLRQRRTLLLLDNAETLVAAAHRQDAEALRLAQFLQQLPDEHISLLVTSQRLLGWNGEQSLELGGLTPHEGVLLFRQSAPQRANDIDLARARQLSTLIDHHPLALLLLGKDFNSSQISLAAFVAEYEAHLLSAENTYQDIDHRHRKLYATFEKSIGDLPPDPQRLYARLWLFHAPFLPAAAVAIFDPEFDEKTGDHSSIEDHLYTLWQRSLLAREGTSEDGLLLYRVPPVMRPFIERYLADTSEREALLARFGGAYANLVGYLYDELNCSGAAPYLASQCREDLDRGILQVVGIEQGYYLLHWGWILQHIGDRTQGLSLTEQAFEVAQELDQELTLDAMNNMALIYYMTGRPQEALHMYEQALRIKRAMGDCASEATTLNNMAIVYRAIGRPQEALHMYEQALCIRREVSNRAGEATTLNNIAVVYHATSQPQEALRRYEQALSILKEVSDRAGEATTLNNMGEVYRAIGQPQEALRCLGQALPIIKEVGDLAGEAIILSNMGLAYNAAGQL
jgi:tetratricopeptide (TPR) repeat protein